MSKVNINRLRVVLAEQSRTNRWLAEQLGVNEGTVSHWTTNNKQPSVQTFYNIAIILKVDIRELFEPTFHKK
jgi:transcriptional regulator with XRE-family HTH domain